MDPIDFESMSTQSSDDSRIATFAARLPFGLDPFQLEAIEAVEAGDSVLVAAPTGSGKTVVAEFGCWAALQDGGKCFYTTPLKALSNQKFGDLIAHHGASAVGLLTGDNAINGNAPLVVMTTEVLRNMLYERSETLRGLQYVVMDEVHYLQDPYRGAVWEEVLIHLAPDVRVICLSATVSNLEQFGDWLTAIRGTTKVVVERQRPVELRNMALVGEKLYPLLNDADHKVGRISVDESLERAWNKAQSHSVHTPQAGRHRKRGPSHSAIPTRVEVADILADANMLPAICFIFSRAGCDRSVDSCLYAGVRLTTDDEAERIREFAELRAAALPDEDLRALGFETFLEALTRGISAHHAGMLPVFKETVEELFAMGLCKLVFATETLSLGINMPARTVVIEKLSKFTGERHELLTPMDYTQLTGRAGRRGIDSLGFAVVVFNPFVTIDKVATLATVKTYPLTSSFRPSYNMAVNLVRSYDAEDAIRMLNSSFAQFVIDREVVVSERRLVERREQASQLQESLKCELGDVMEYYELHAKAMEAQQVQRGSAAVVEAFDRLQTGDVIWSHGIGRALVLEEARKAGGAVPRITLMTADRKLRRVTARDFKVPPTAAGRVMVRGQGWRSPKVRRDLLKRMDQLNLERPAPIDRSEMDAAMEAWTSHPVYDCPDATRHLNDAEAYAKATGQTSALKGRVRRRRNTLAKTFEKVLAVLRALGYVDDWEVTEKGHVLRQVYNEADLLVVECVHRGWLSGLDAEELAAVASLFTYQARGRDEPESAPTPHLSRYHRRIANLFQQLKEIEDREGVDLLAEPDAGFMAAMYEWAGGATLEAVLHDRDMSAGDFVRSSKQVVDLLQQLKQVAVNPDLGDTLAEAVRAVQRGVVAYSSVV